MNAKKQSPLPFEGETQTDLFRPSGKPIRKVFHNDEWYFSIVDVIEAVTESSSPSRYWNELREKMRQETGDELFAKIEKLKMPSADEKQRETDAANTETLFRIIQSIPSPKAEPFKKWLARVGFERIEETHDPEKAIQRAMITYKLKGYPDEWINARIRTILSRKELTGEWAKRGVKEGLEYAILTNVISQETFNKSTQGHKDYKNLTKADNLRDHMTDIELILTMLGEKSTVSIAIARDATGLDANKSAAHVGGKIAGDARKNLERELGRSVVSKENYLNNKSVQDHLIDEGSNRSNFS
ncbi:BRO family protein [Dehalococcoides mccartyi]|uniref:BRO family protein n=1 Tax=Dehalococcoides mccartyi TaxID=61435 RepID=UPI000994A2B2|nr:BRO family protein [Dehalococcoides mccartyi]